tara:strand:+ start:3972 stop:4958 length:987 start_codon:yes stop_codon:yes gene_type:complete
MKNIAIILIALFSTNVFSSTDTELSFDIVAKARALQLSKHSTWHKLLHYEQQLFPRNQLVSTVLSEDFFNSPEGKANPESELTATLRAFTDPAPENPNHHAQCEFRGRYLWLKEMLDFDSLGLESIPCHDFEDWSLNGTTQSISLVLATGYLGNPASYYGHTLIKLNSSESNDRTPLEDVTINYGAIIPENEGSLPYIFKGLFGGYRGGFSHIQYYYHDYNYGENELRNLWEYELNLSQEEVNLVLGHSWEVLGKEYTYFFLNENCAYQMARILEVVEGVELLPKNTLWTLPQSLIQRLAQAKHKEKPLVKTIKYHPSRQSRLYEKYE